MSYTESTMKEIIEKFIKQQAYRSRHRSTAKHYMSDLRIFHRHVGDKGMEQVSVEDIDGFVAAQSEQGLTASTINRRLATLQAFFAYWASEAPDEGRSSPVNWRRHGVKQGHPLPRDASDSVVDRLFEVVDDPRDRAIWGLMVGAGLRVGEVIALEVADLETPADPTEIARLRVCGKGEKERIVWLTAPWRQLLANWLAVRPPAVAQTVFVNQHQRPLTVDGVQFRLRQYCQRAGIEVTCHQLRHTLARRLAEQRMPIESISRLLGHAQVTTTQRYTNGADPDLRQALLEAMADLPVPPVCDPAASPVAPPPADPSPAPPQPAVPPPPAPVADLSQLAAALARFQDLPAWLAPLLVVYLRTRWRHWQPHLAPTHAHRLARQLRRIWDGLLAQRPLTGWEDLRRTDLESWLQQRAATGLAISSQRNELSDLLAFLRFVTEQDIALPAALFHVPYPQRPTPLPRYLSPDEFSRLYQTVLTQTQDASPAARLDRAWFITLAHTGLRLSELLNLRLADLDLAGGRLFVCGSKNGVDRVAYLTPTLSQALRDYLAVRPASSDDHLWLDHHQPLRDHQLRYRLRRWGQVAGLAVSPHRLRHTFATQLVNQGLSLEAVRRLLGHQTLTMTQHYARLYDHTVKEQFVAAMAQIEGIATLDWPTIAAVSTEHKVTVSDLSDSV